LFRFTYDLEVRCKYEKFKKDWDGELERPIVKLFRVPIIIKALPYKKSDFFGTGKTDDVPAHWEPVEKRQML